LTLGRSSRVRLPGGPRIRRLRATFADSKSCRSAAPPWERVERHPEFAARTIAESPVRPASRSAGGEPVRAMGRRIRSFRERRAEGRGGVPDEDLHDLRLLSSGPRCGIGRSPCRRCSRLLDHAGKVNPVILEVAIQVAAQVIGNERRDPRGGLGCSN